MKPDTFIHPYQWYWSWIHNPVGYWYIAAPYGYLWYGLNLVAMLGFLPWMLYLFTVDTMASYLIIQRQNWAFIGSWMLSSQFFLNYDGVDYFVFLFSSLGFITPVFSALALLVKLPLGAPSYVWDFILHSPMSAANWINWGRYAWFGAWWVGGIALYFKRRRAKARLPTGLPVNS